MVSRVQHKTRSDDLQERFDPRLVGFVRTTVAPHGGTISYG
jgi:hypothetical protein